MMPETHDGKGNPLLTAVSVLVVVGIIIFLYFNTDIWQSGRQSDLAPDATSTMAVVVLDVVSGIVESVSAEGITINVAKENQDQGSPPQVSGTFGPNTKSVELKIRGSEISSSPTTLSAVTKGMLVSLTRTERDFRDSFVVSQVTISK